MKTELTPFERKEILNELVKSKHGDLQDYVPTGLKAAKYDPEFLAHLIAWNLAKGEIRDTKVALPIIHLRNLNSDDKELAENAIASLMTLDPRNLVRAYHFNKDLSKAKKTITGGHRKMLEKAMKRYLEVQESQPGRWTRTAVQHRASLKELYAVSHHKPSDLAQQVLFDRKYPKGSVFEKLANMKNMDPMEAAGAVINHKIPFQIAQGALGMKKEDYAKNPTFILALIEGMSGQQLLNSTKFLSDIGVMANPMLKSEYDKALQRAAGDKKVSTLKVGKVLSTVKVDEATHAKLSNLQEKKINQKGIDGDWLVLGDCSGSMNKAIIMANEVASIIARSVKGKVFLVFFNNSPRLFDVTGKTLEEIKVMTKYVTANGSTSVGCGVRYLQEKGIVVNGIAIISDGGDNATPLFHDAYKDYVKKMAIEPAVYFYKLPGDTDKLSRYCQMADVQIESFDLTTKVDNYSIPNLVAMMKTSRYGLLDEIMETPLLTLDKVFAERD